MKRRRRRRRVQWLSTLLLLACGGCGDGFNHDVSVPDGRTAEIQCMVTFGLAGEGPVEEVDVEIDHRTAGGDFVDSNGQVECQSLIPGAMVSLTDNDSCYVSPGCDLPQPDVLFLGLLAPPGFLTAPRDLVRCKWIGVVRPAAEQFAFTYAWYSPRDKEPALGVSKIRCTDDNGTPTTTSSTSTTLETCAEHCAPGEQCVDDSCAGPSDYELTFSIAETTSFGALDFDVHHDCSLGSFIGEGEFVSCKLGPFNAFASFNDLSLEEGGCDPMRHQLAAGIMSIEGIDTPVDLFTCRFRTAGRAPLASDFLVVIDDVTDPELRPIVPSPVPRVTRIRNLLNQPRRPRGRERAGRDVGCRSGSSPSARKGRAANRKSARTCRPRSTRLRRLASARQTVND